MVRSATHPEAVALAKRSHGLEPTWREAFVIALVIVAIGGLIVLAIKWQHTTVLLKRMAPRAEAPSLCGPAGCGMQRIRSTTFELA